MSREVMVRLSGMEIVCWKLSECCNHAREVVSATYVDTLEPHSNVRDECYISAQLPGNLLLVDVIDQAVRNQVVGEVVHIVLRARLGSCSRVTRDAENSRLSTNEIKERRDTELSGGCVAARVGYPCSTVEL